MEPCSQEPATSQYPEPASLPPLTLLVWETKFHTNTKQQVKL
jgi:hypothetical protein